MLACFFFFTFYTVKNLSFRKIKNNTVLTKTSVAFAFSGSLLFPRRCLGQAARNPRLLSLTLPALRSASSFACQHAARGLFLNSVPLFVHQLCGFVPGGRDRLRNTMENEIGPKKVIYA